MPGARTWSSSYERALHTSPPIFTRPPSRSTCSMTVALVPTSAGADPARVAAVPGFQEPAGGQPIEVEGGQCAGEPERVGRLLPAHRTSLGHHPLVKRAPGGLSQQTEGDDIPVSGIVHD